MGRKNRKNVVDRDLESDAVGASDDQPMGAGEAAPPALHPTPPEPPAAAITDTDPKSLLLAELNAIGDPFAQVQRVNEERKACIRRRRESDEEFAREQGRLDHALLEAQKKAGKLADRKAEIEKLLKTGK